MKTVFILLITLSSLNLFAQNNLADPFGVTYDSEMFTDEDEKILSILLENFNLNLNGLIKIKSHSKDYFDLIKNNTHNIYYYSKEGNNISLESFFNKKKNKQLKRSYSLFSHENGNFKKITLIIF